MIIIVIKDKEKSIVVRITNREIAAKLRYFKAMSEESYTKIFENIFLRGDVKEEVTRVTRSIISKSTGELQKISEQITPNTHGIIETIKIILFKLNDLNKYEKDRIALNIYEELLNIKERAFSPKLLRSV